MGNLKHITINSQKDKNELERTIIQLLPNTHFDIIISHNSFGENTENKIQESVNESIIKLMHEEYISADELWTFASEDGDMKYYPNSTEQPEVLQRLSKRVWAQKNKIMTRIFGFNENSKEARNVPLTEAFWKYNESIHPKKSARQFGYNLNIFRSPNIEALKFLYHKSIAYVYDQNYWKIDDTTENPEIIDVEVDNKKRYSYKNIGKELNIFKSSSIENLKSLYYKSISFLFDRDSWRSETYEREFSFTDIDVKYIKRRIRRNGDELKIFRNSSIENLKSLYSKSLGFVFDHNKAETDKTLNMDENNTTLNSEDLFMPTTIENLKSRYYFKRSES
ncbi:MAG: hypothetical protein PHS59_04910 [Paludibacter sp.]|nr:hypothetical protein [Paludibacter sp.]